MKKFYNRELKIRGLESETPLESIESLEEFFKADMWYAKHAEWKTEDDMLKYLHIHFKICKYTIKKIMKKKNG